MNLKQWFTCTDAKDALYKGGATLLWLLSGLATLMIVGAVIMLTRGDVADVYENTITVSGKAEIFAVPDIATVTFNVTKEAADLSKAQVSVTETMNELIKVLRDQNIDEEDIKTQDYSSNPRYEYNRKTGERTLAGYEVRHTVMVKIRNLEKVGDVVARLGSFDIDSMYGPNFDIDSPEGLQEEVRSQAIDDAKAQAKRLAKELDVRLGKMVSFNENGGGYMPLMKTNMVSMSMDASGDEILAVPEMPTGEQSVTANVSITYKIK